MPRHVASINHSGADATAAKQRLSGLQVLRPKCGLTSAGRFGDLGRAFLGDLGKSRSGLASEVELEIAREPKEPLNIVDPSSAVVAGSGN